MELGKLSYGSDYYSGKYNTGVKRKKADEAACTYTRTGGGKDRRTGGPADRRRKGGLRRPTRSPRPALCFDLIECLTFSVFISTASKTYNHVFCNFMSRLNKRIIHLHSFALLLKIPLQSPEYIPPLLPRPAPHGGVPLPEHANLGPGGEEVGEVGSVSSQPFAWLLAVGTYWYLWGVGTQMEWESALIGMAVGT